MSKLRYWITHVWLVVVIAAVWATLDQWTKGMIRETIPLHESTVPIVALGPYFAFEHVNNYGAAFGILQNRWILFVAIAVVVTVAILFYVRYLPLEQRFIRVLLGLQLGGAIGNLVDRLMRGYVTDFVRVGVPDVYIWPNFNIADSGIVIGVIGLGAYILWEDFRLQRQQRQESAITTGSAAPSEASEA